MIIKLFGALRKDAVNHRQYPHRSQSELHSVPATSRKISQIVTIPAEYVQYSKDRKTM